MTAILNAMGRPIRGASDPYEGKVLKLRTVKLQDQDLGFQAVFIHDGVPHVVCKLLSQGQGKPKTREEAFQLLQQLVDWRPDLIEPYEQGKVYNTYR